jgi:hypothetical protein
MLHSSVSTADRVSTTFFGSIPVCEAHEEDFCGRCLNVDEPSAYELNLAECSGDSRFFGKTSSSCSPWYVFVPSTCRRSFTLFARLLTMDDMP